MAAIPRPQDDFIRDVPRSSFIGHIAPASSPGTMTLADCRVEGVHSVHRNPGKQQAANRACLRERCAHMKSLAIGVLERQAEDGSHQLPLSDRAEARFLSANHDLRQALHALGLFSAQLRSCSPGTERERIVDQIDAALSALNERLNELFEVSRGAIGTLPSNGADIIATPSTLARNPLRDRYIVVIDDDPLVLDGTCGLL
jgi:hypothetical protein